MRSLRSAAIYADIINRIINEPDGFVRWPESSHLLLPGVDRSSKYHAYPPDVLRELKALGIPADTRSNGPAIAAFLYMKGKRPMRCTHRGWSIHHIYDGKFPAKGHKTTLHAVKSGEHFTESAGLVALHPIADAVADEFEEFAWWLREQAYIRFGYDPDQVFAKPTKEAETQPMKSIHVIQLAEDAHTDRKWIGRDDNGTHHHGTIPLNQKDITLKLSWKASTDDVPRQVGRYKINLPGLEQEGYVCKVSAGYYLRFQHTSGRIEIAINRSTAPLEVGRWK